MSVVLSLLVFLAVSLSLLHNEEFSLPVASIPSESFHRRSSMCLRIICVIALAQSPSLGMLNSLSLASLSTICSNVLFASGLFRNLGAGDPVGQICFT